MIAVNGSSHKLHYVLAVGYENVSTNDGDNFIIVDPADGQLKHLSEREPYTRGDGPMIVPINYDMIRSKHIFRK